MNASVTPAAAGDGEKQVNDGGNPTSGMRRRSSRVPLLCLGVLQTLLDLLQTSRFLHTVALDE